MWKSYSTDFKAYLNIHKLHGDISYQVFFTYNFSIYYKEYSLLEILFFTWRSVHHILLGLFLHVDRYFSVDIVDFSQSPHLLQLECARAPSLDFFRSLSALTPLRILSNLMALNTIHMMTASTFSSPKVYLLNSSCHLCIFLHLTNRHLKLNVSKAKLLICTP